MGPFWGEENEDQGNGLETKLSRGEQALVPPMTSLSSRRAITESMKPNSAMVRVTVSSSAPEMRLGLAGSGLSEANGTCSIWTYDVTERSRGGAGLPKGRSFAGDHNGHLLFLI